MKTGKKISILIPCRNEEKGISKVIGSIPKIILKKNGFLAKIIVIDNGSVDNTGKIARKLKSTVVYLSERGKGNAIREGLKNIDKDTDFVVIIDGDNTYKSHEILRLIEPIECGFADMIVGSRLSGRTNVGSLTLSHRIANWFYTFLVRHFYRVNTTDVLSGFLAMRKKVAVDLLRYIESEGFEIEMELNIKAAKLGYKIFSVPITYDIRVGESKIETFRDVFAIFSAFLKYLTWKPGKKIQRKRL